jgi:uncharacterized protein
MRLVEMEFPDARPVTGYGPGFFRIGDAVHEGPMLAGPRGIAAWGGLEDHAALLEIADEIDVLFVGTGGEIAQIPRALRQAMEAANVGVEIMASPTACRSYNVLLSEGRRIALAALPVA